MFSWCLIFNIKNEIKKNKKQEKKIELKFTVVERLVTGELFFFFPSIRESTFCGESNDRNFSVGKRIARTHTHTRVLFQCVCFDYIWISISVVLSLNVVRVCILCLLLNDSQRSGSRRLVFVLMKLMRWFLCKLFVFFFSLQFKGQSNGRFMIEPQILWKNKILVCAYIQC